MESERSVKRRKLDGADTNGTSIKSSHDAWADAKAKSLARRGKRLDVAMREQSDVDVYDDIDGAHSNQSPLKKASVNSTPQKKQLDPLRNQKAVVTSSPSKTTSTLGFFKQFHKPKPNTATPNLNGNVNEPANGLGSRSGKNEARANGDAETDSSESEEEDEEIGNQSPVPPSAKGNWKGWSYERPKKTFEDEIRDLEDVAREEAGKDESDGGITVSVQKRGDRRASAKKVDDSGAREKSKVTKFVVQQSPELLKTQKANRAERKETVKFPRVQGEDHLMTDAPGSERRLENGEQQPRNHSLDKTPTKPKPFTFPTSTTTMKERTFSGDALRLIQNVVLEKLTAKRPMRLVNLDDEYSKLAHMITHTVTAGESNSMLVIGARGSGKTALVNQILREQTTEHADDFHVVRLNGFVHTDDKIALREIWRQLGREMDLDEEDNTSKNLADTLTTLLALLSHPAEQGREESGQITKSVIFILDEFELFASHPRQTLLYNLFDIAQSRKAPIAVLGLTTRIDVAESLEKRVKSRFSHRYVHLSSAKSFAAFQEACKAAITIHRNELSAEEIEQLDLPTALTGSLEKVSKAGKKDAIADWNATVKMLLSQDALAAHLHRLYYTTKSIPEFHASILMPVYTMSIDSTNRSTDIIEHFTTSLAASSLKPPDSKIDLLSSLSTLHLALLICAARLTNIHNCETVPFVQAYEEYKVLASKAKLQASASGALAQGAGSRVWGKEVARGAWDELVEFGLVMEDGSRGGRVDVGLEEIGMSGVELGSWGRWCKEV